MRDALLFVLLWSNAICAPHNENAIFSHFDLTHDGMVDGRELRTVAYVDYKTPPEISDEILHRSDTNADGMLDRSELRTAKKLIDANAQRTAEKWLKEHDVDKDGRINEAELLQGEYVEHGQSFAQIRECFQQADMNNDSFLNTLELTHVRRLLRAIAMKDSAEIMKKYDSDDDHFLSLPEAQILADEIFDMGPDTTATLLDGVDHRKAKKINELELVDFLSDLREEAAIAALDKLTALDKNGNGMVTFDEIVKRYGSRLKKTILKKIFSEVDVNKNANIDPIEYVSMQNLISMWNRESASSKDSSKKRRIITVTMPRSPELEALIEARKQQDAKSFYRNNNQPKRVRLARQAGQPKEDATLLASDHNGMDEPSVETGSNHLNEIKDYTGAQIRTSHQPTAAQLEDDSHLSRASSTLPPTTTFTTIAQKTTNVVAVSTSIKSNNDVTLTVTTASASSTSDPGNADTPTKFTTIVKGGMAPTSAATKSHATKARDPKSKSITSEDPIRNEQEPMKASFTEKTKKMRKHSDNRGEKVGSIDDSQLPRIDEASEVNENGERIHTETNDNEYSLLTVKDSDGNVISNQATMDFKKFERFIEQMRKDIHRIVEMEINRSAEMMNKTKIIDGNVTSDFRHSAAVREHNITHTADKHHSKKEEKFVDSIASGQSQTKKKNYESNATTGGEKIRSEIGNFSKIETSKKDDPLPPETDDYKMIEAIEKLESEYLKSFQDVENRIAEKERTTNEKGEVVHTEVYNASEFRTIPSTRHFKEDAFGNPIVQQDKGPESSNEGDGGKPPQGERRTNDKGEVVHTEVSDASEFRTIPSTSHFKEDAFGNPIVQQDKGPESFNEGDGGKLPQGERRTNDKGEVVHTEVSDASEFRTIPSTRHFKEDAFGNPVVQQDKNGKPLVEDDRNKLPVPERITNEKGEVVHSKLISDDFAILQVTDKMGNKLSGEELRGEAKNESSEEDDFFVEESEISTSTKAQHSVDRASDFGRSDVLKKTVNFSNSVHHANEMNATNLQKGGTKKHNNKKDERGLKEKKGSTKNKNKKNKENTKDSERQASVSRKMDNKNSATNSKSDHQKIGGIDKHKQNNEVIKESTSSRSNHHEAQEKKETNQNSTGMDAAESVKSHHEERKEDERKQSNMDMKKATKSKKGHHGKQKTKERKEKSTSHKKNEKRKQKKPKARPLRCLNETEVGLSVANETSLIDDLSVHLWNLEQRNRTIDFKRLGDDPLDGGGEEGAPLYRMEDGAEPATAPPAPDFGSLRDDEIRAKVDDSLMSTVKHSALSGGRADAHNFEETLAIMVAYNDTNFS